MTITNCELAVNQIRLNSIFQNFDTVKIQMSEAGGKVDSESQVGDTQDEPGDEQNSENQENENNQDSEINENINEGDQAERRPEEGLADVSNTMTAALLGDDNENQNHDNEGSEVKRVKKKRKIRVKKIKENEGGEADEKNEDENNNDGKNEEEDKNENNENEQKEENENNENNSENEKTGEDDESEYQYEYEYYYSDDENISGIREPSGNANDSPSRLRLNNSRSASNASMGSTSSRRSRSKPKSLSFSNPITLIDTARPYLIAGVPSPISDDMVPVNEAETQTDEVSESELRASSKRSSRRNYSSPNTPRKAIVPPPNRRDNGGQNSFSQTSPRVSRRSNKNYNSFNSTTGSISSGSSRSKLPRLARTMPSPSTPRTPTAPEDVQKYVKKAINKEPILGVSDEVYADILFELSERRKNYARQHKYNEGDQMTEAINFVEQCQVDNAKNNLQDDFKRNYEEEKSQLQQTLKDFDAETKKMLQELEEKHKAQREVLLAEQRQEREEHREKWTSPWMVRQYNRCTAQLTTLRKQHALLLTQCRFKEADVVHQQIVARQKMEEDTNAKAYQFDYDESNKKLKEKQKTEERFFNAQCEVAIEKLNVKRAKRRSAYEYKEKRIEQKGILAEDADKIWNASMLQRVENNATIQKTRSEMPSTKMTRSDIADEDVQVLELPPLKLDLEKDDQKPKSAKETTDEE
ncbi:hypothetical protein TRFO_32316 [Tritrichomonas foetus]|uniref:Uncharacterized protein n=1 Tax=Tritrichomonas foetus TaxID=1144522 RepID=A0A1J4JQ67_9EUKA|nr:hypothetical protein TRFO_32316 [Tritrichomonas foetus]|eukprot:OHT00890.1 hypothetical protein TRFO_32316 [Tritrichomonas foetus]